MLVLPSQSELVAERCRRSFRDFIAAAWPLVEPATSFVGNWHIDVIAEHLEAASNREIRKLVINIPPRHMKSLQVAVFWPAWVWLTNPERRFIYASYAQSLSTTHSVLARRLISSLGSRDPNESPDPDRLLEQFGYLGIVDLLNAPSNRWRLCGDQNLKRRFENTRTGSRLATSVGGSVTGEGGDILVLDDPHKPEEAQSDVMRQRVLDWHDGTWTTRQNNAETGVQVIVMQRLHEEDLTGHVLSHGDYVHLCLPAYFEPSHPFIWPDDPRTEPGEVLWRAQWGNSWLEEKQLELGSYGFGGQYQQLPAPAEGGIFKRAWWRYYDELPPPNSLVISWDMTFKDSDGSDYVVGQLWLADRADRYLVAQIRARMDFTATIKAVAALRKFAIDRWPKAPLTNLIEDTANGPAVISSLRHDIPGLIAVKPLGGKEARAHAAAPQVESGNVFLPKGDIPAPRSYAPTSTDAFIDECAAFPNAAFDDQVDALTQALNRLKRGAIHRPEARSGGGRRRFPTT